MEHEDFCSSLPYIDDSPTDDEKNFHQYNLKIIENYHNQNRNIEISNRSPNNASKSLSPVAPLENETEFSDQKINDFLGKNTYKKMRNESGMKLTIRGWDSSIRIQGLDNKSSITFKRRCEKVRKKAERKEEGKSNPVTEEVKSFEKSRKGRWKMLTRSIMLTKSARFERKGLDERYPKYVLLKNEEEEITEEKENYPKMFMLDDKNSKQKKFTEAKTEFSFKKTFKNKTEPIAPLEEILAETEVQTEKPKVKTKEEIKKQKKSLTQRKMGKKKIIDERRKSQARETKAEQPCRNEPVSARPHSHSQICNEIQGIFKDTLKFVPQVQSEESQQLQKPVEYFSSMPPQFCQFSCHDPFCCAPPQDQPPKYTPVYASHKPHVYKAQSTQNKSFLNQEIEPEEQIARDVEVDLGNLPFGMLSNFFPRVVIMNTIRSNSLGGEEEINNVTNETVLENSTFRKLITPKTEEMKDGWLQTKSKAAECLEVPKQDLTLRTRMVQGDSKPELEIKELFLDDGSSFGLKEFSSLDEDQNTESQENEATEYLHYSELDLPENESVELPSPATLFSQNDSKKKKDKTLFSVDQCKIEDVVENSENLSLTKIGYKMYDNLTKLSLNREKDMTKKAEVSGCGCKENGTKNPPYNITLELNNSVLKITVPENEINFQIINSQEADVQVGVMSEKKGKEENKKTVTREELWHCDDGGRALVLQNEKNRRTGSNEKVFQNFKISLANKKEVLLIELNEKNKKQEQEKEKEKSTKEMKVGTDDFDLAGGDFECAFGENYKNLSPRIGQLLKHLHKKLETDEKERKFLDEKITQKLIDQKFQERILPGVFLVKQINPRMPVSKKSAEVSSFRKQKKTTENQEQAGQLREYYCEECLATMRIYEDENPSVKSMVDKFETIIQLENY